MTTMMQNGTKTETAPSPSSTPATTPESPKVFEHLPASVTREIQRVQERRESIKAVSQAESDRIRTAIAEQDRRMAECMAENRRRNEEHQREYRNAEFLKCVPMRHRIAQTDFSAGTPWGDAFQRLEAIRGTGFTAAILGNCGTGKTQISVELIRQHYFDPKPGADGTIRGAVYTTADEMLGTIRDGMKDKYKTEGQYIEKFGNTGLLVIDEIDKRKVTEWGESKLIRIIDRRYRDMRDTVLIANIVPKAFAQSVGPSIADRVREAGVVIECTWPSHRRRPKN